MKVLGRILQFVNILKYKKLSTNNYVTGSPIYKQACLLMGKGQIVFKEGVTIGIEKSPFFYNSYTYIEARNSNSKVVIEDNVWINNNATFLSEGEGIIIKTNTIIGTGVEIYDSDFHELAKDKRMTGSPKTAEVVIGENVWIGSNVRILKGVNIGNNSVIANSSVVTKSFPENVIIGGIPASIIQQL